MTAQSIEFTDAWGSDTWKKERDVYLREWIGNEHAYRFLMDVSDICELWDDIVDADKELTVEHVNAVFMRALISLPLNPFYAHHRSFLTPIIITSINSWMDANLLKQGSRSERAVAYTTRNMDIQVIQAIIYLTRGQEFLRTVSPQLWKMFAAEQDDFVAWVDGETT